MFAACNAQSAREAAFTGRVVGINTTIITPVGELVTPGCGTSLVWSVSVTVSIAAHNNAVPQVVGVAATLASGRWALNLHD
jgi:hypothetical protein